MNNEEKLLQRIKELEKELKLEKEAHARDNREWNLKYEEKLKEIEIIKEKYNIERVRIFIPKTEVLNEAVINETEEVLKEEKKVKKTNKGKKYNKKKIDYEKYVVETKVIEPDEDICPLCGQKLVNASEKVKYLVEVTPAKIKVIKVIKRSKKCPNCNKKDNKIYYPVLTDNITGSILTPSLASFVAYHKYELGIPFEHLSKHITNSIGFEINKQNLANYMAKTAKILEPIYDKLKEDLLRCESKVIHSDETTLVVSKKDEENKDRKKSYVYVYSSSYYDNKRIRIYDFHESRNIDETSNWLKGYEGIIECDNYSGYNKLKKANKNIKLQKCWAHVRRRYVDIVKNLKGEDKKGSIAFKILEKIKQLFYLEKTYKEKRLLVSQIVEERKRNVPKIKESLYELVFKCNPLPNSKLYEAIEYTKDCWDDLFTFVDNGYVEISNNIAEQAVKPFVIQRKVFQTSGSYAGARYTGKLFSIIQTCKINNIHVEKYLEYVLNNINKLDINELLPYSKSIKKATG